MEQRYRHSRHSYVFTHLNNVSLLAAGCGERQDALVWHLLLFRAVQLQVVRQADVAVVSPVTSCRAPGRELVEEVVENKHIKLVDHINLGM